MNSFKEITKNINSDIEYFEDSLRGITESHQDILSEILDYIFEAKGKRIRPSLVYLASRLFNAPSKSTHTAALLVEVMHTATLLHDDVVDQAVLRRGYPSVNHKWDDKTAVLTGDFLFAKAMKIATDNNEYKLFDIITPAVMNLSMGELMQMKYSKEFSVDIDQYFEIIKSKTASLMSVCCEAGAYTAGANTEEINLCKKLGEVIGCIFQIKDDILDYIGNSNTGKEIGIDIKEKKVTLPLICAWNNMNQDQQSELLSLWNSIDNFPEKSQKIIKIVVDNKGIVGSEKIMAERKNEAVEIINQFSDSDAKYAFGAIIDFIINRDN